jgi:hypothetical protein
VNRTELDTPLYWLYGPSWEWLHYVQDALFLASFESHWPPRWAVFLLLLTTAVSVLLCAAAAVDKQIDRVNRVLRPYALAPALALLALLGLACKVIERWGCGPYEIRMVRRSTSSAAQPAQEGQEAA